MDKLSNYMLGRMTNSKCLSMKAVFVLTCLFHLVIIRSILLFTAPKKNISWKVCIVSLCTFATTCSIATWGLLIDQVKDVKSRAQDYSAITVKYGYSFYLILFGSLGMLSCLILLIVDLMMTYTKDRRHYMRTFIYGNHGMDVVNVNTGATTPYVNLNNLNLNPSTVVSVPPPPPTPMN